MMNENASYINAYTDKPLLPRDIGMSLNNVRQTITGSLKTILGYEITIFKCHANFFEF